MLRIPAIGLEVAVLEGTDDLTLNRAVGRIAGTARPGRPGNMGVAGTGRVLSWQGLPPGGTLELETLAAQRLCTRSGHMGLSPSHVECSIRRRSPRCPVNCFPFYHSDRASVTSSAPS